MNAARVIVRDLRTFRNRLISFRNIGAFLGAIRKDTPTEDKRNNTNRVSRRELAEWINHSLRANELPISLHTIWRIEAGKNMFGGYMMRVIQIARALDCNIKFRSAKTFIES